MWKKIDIEDLAMEHGGYEILEGGEMYEGGTYIEMRHFLTLGMYRIETTTTGIRVFKLVD